MLVNQIIVSLKHNIFEEDQIVQKAGSICVDIYFVRSGGVAVCETTCFKEPILTYGPGSCLNLYYVLMKKTAQFQYLANKPGTVCMSISGSFYLDVID